MNKFSAKSFGASQHAWIVFIAVIAILSLGLGGLIWLTQASDNSLSDFRRQFAGLRDLESQWDREILSLQLGISPNYDAVTNTARDLKLGLAKLEAQSSSDESLTSTQPLVKSYRESVEQKAWLSEQVKASYAMLRNSVAVLPNAISDAYEHPEALKAIAGGNKRVSDLLTETITGMVSFTISPTALLRDSVEERINHTRAAAQSVSPELSDAINRFLVQIEVVIKERQRGNELMLAITAVPIEVAANRVQTELQSLEETKAGTERMLWDLTVTLAALLVLTFVAFVFVLSRRFVQLGRDNRMLQEVNENVEEQLMQSAKLSALGQMVAGITHEINTPLAYVKAVFELIRERMLVAPEKIVKDVASEDDEEAAREAREELEILLDDGLHGIEEITTLVRTMKNFSRLDKGHIESFSVEEGLESALLIARSELKYVAEVKREFDSVPQIMGSPSQIRQVLLNLVVNAVDAMTAMDRRGILTLRTRITSSDTVQIDVCDNGPGIPEDVIGKIFDPFFTTKPVGQGTGMGLSICYRIVENHGGTITVSSKPGKGTVFTITLPRQGEKFPESHPSPNVAYDKSKPSYAA
ncbi:ATP-binding protein [Agrobacterium sp. SHOUNA12C]|nr:ATP-binding protein [Agrobacterium sp. BETTINA12B]MCJ9755136.1 ATP-binding protein [Agrobacterium sp. SHOUNA12C]